MSSVKRNISSELLVLIMKIRSLLLIGILVTINREQSSPLTLSDMRPPRDVDENTFQRLVKMQKIELMNDFCILESAMPYFPSLF